jgi:hypothetical protein
MFSVCNPHQHNQIQHIDIKDVILKPYHMQYSKCGSTFFRPVALVVGTQLLGPSSVPATRSFRSVADAIFTITRGANYRSERPGIRYRRTQILYVLLYKNPGECIAGLRFIKNLHSLEANSTLTMRLRRILLTALAISYILWNKYHHASRCSENHTRPDLLAVREDHL